MRASTPSDRFDKDRIPDLPCREIPVENLLVDIASDGVEPIPCKEPIGIVLVEAHLHGLEVRNDRGGSNLEEGLPMLSKNAEFRIDEGKHGIDIIDPADPQD